MRRARSPPIGWLGGVFSPPLRGEVWGGPSFFWPRVAPKDFSRVGELSGELACSPPGFWRFSRAGFPEPLRGDPSGDTFGFGNAVPGGLPVPGFPCPKAQKTKGFKGPKCPVKFVAFGGDGSTYDIGISVVEWSYGART